MIDPLSGYYEDGLRDAQTGVPVTPGLVVTNLDRMGVQEADYRIIQQLSTNPDAIKEASDRQYDFVLIDGDHSLRGVSNDFKNLAPLVRPGGILMFDDYDTIAGSTR